MKTVNAIRRKLRAKGHKLTAANASLEDRIKEIITIAFGKEENLVAGFAVENQGIEKARKTINILREKLDNYCAVNLVNYAEVKAKVVELIDTSLLKVGKGKIASYRIWILRTLKETIVNAKDEVEIIRTLDAFEFSCTLDILHDKTSREQNIWGLTMAGKLQKAISKHDEETIFDVLL